MSERMVGPSQLRRRRLGVRGVVLAAALFLSACDSEPSGRGVLSGSVLANGEAPGSALILFSGPGLIGAEGTGGTRAWVSEPVAGSQELRVLLPGTTERAAAVFVDVRHGAPVEAPRFVVPSSEVMTTVTGTVVTADARPISGARVVLLSAIGDVLGDAVVTGADGRFARSVRAGAADRVVAEWLSSGAERPDRAESPVPLSAGALRDIVLVLRQAQ